MDILELIAAASAATGRLAVSLDEIGVGTNIRRSVLDDQLDRAVTDGTVTRRRHANGEMLYRVSDVPTGAITMTPLTTRHGPKPGTARVRYQAPDMSDIKVTMCPELTRATPSTGRKWEPLFSRLRAITPTAGQYPTVELPARLGKAVAAAVRSEHRRAEDARYKVSINAKRCLVQRVA